MRVAGGGTMFCIDPPAADPGWKWKVPLAWVTVYGISAFLGVLVGSLRPKSITTPIIICLATVVMFVVARRWPHSSEQLQYMEREFAYGFPALLFAGIVACVIVIMTRRTEQASCSRPRTSAGEEHVRQQQA